MLGKGRTVNACSKASETWGEWGGRRDAQRPGHVSFPFYSGVSGKPESDVKLNSNIVRFAFRTIPQEADDGLYVRWGHQRRGHWSSSKRRWPE